MNRRLFSALFATLFITTAQAKSPLEEWVRDTTKDFVRTGEVSTTPFSGRSSYATCFTPGEDCEGLIVRSIKSSNSSILVLAYSFTSAPIAKALANAKSRGVDVRVILDKSQRSEKYTGATYLRNANIPVFIDEKPAISHNKVMIFDQNIVLTGSYNFSKSAQERNAENIIVIKGEEKIVKAYTDNWRSRFAVSVPY